MEKIEIIGNLTRNPETRTTQSGRNVCCFDVAVNRRDANGNNTAVYYSVNAWEQLGDICGKYLAKGRKVYVSGRPDVHAWTSNAGEARGAIRITARDVEFLSTRGEEQPKDAEEPAQKPAEENAGEFTEVDDDDELPF